MLKIKFNFKNNLSVLSIKYFQNNIRVYLLNISRTSNKCFFLVFMPLLLPKIKLNRRFCPSVKNFNYVFFMNRLSVILPHLYFNYGHHLPYGHTHICIYIYMLKWKTVRIFHKNCYKLIDQLYKQNTYQ